MITISTRLYRLAPLHMTWVGALLLAGCSESPRQGPASDVAAGRTVVLTNSGLEMVLIEAGEFSMGDPQGAEDETAHRVRVDSFYMDRRPVSQSAYQQVAGVNPSKRQSADAPVERVQWTDAARFCNLCSKADGLTPCYDLETWVCDFSADGYRLPTEAEWEYACRAGSDSPYFFGDDVQQLAKYAWFKPHSKGRTHAVGKKLPNAWGLYDMLGNVWEWCNDYYSPDYYSASPSENPHGPTEGKQRVLRGGAWNVPAERCRVAVRFSEFQVFTDACFGADSYGFRRVKQAAGPPPLAALAINVDEVVVPSEDAESEVAEERVHDPVAAPETAVAAPRTSTLLLLPEAFDRSRLQGKIAFVSDRSGSLDIWSMAADGRDVTQLTNDAAPDADPRFSPSGNSVLFTTLQDGFPQIWTMAANGSARRRITDGSQGCWSPDGESIVFIRDDQAFMRHLESGEERRVTPADWRRCGVPAWSPDGNQLAIASRHLERIGIFLFRTDGTGHRQLQTDDACCTPQWSSDGTMIVFQTDKGHIHIHYTDDGSEEQVTFGADVQHDARFSPDGKFIIYARASSEDGPWQLWLADLESDDLDTFQLTGEGSNRLPDWR